MIRRPPGSTLFPYTTLSDLAHGLGPDQAEIPRAGVVGGRVRLHVARPDQKLLHRPPFAPLAARRSRVFDVSTTKRSCVPRPTSSIGSRTEKRNTTFLLSICSTPI